MDSVLQTTLASVVQQLATFFGMTTETIMENAPMWLAKYGWFTMMQNLPCAVVLWVVLIGILFFAIIGIGLDVGCKSKTIVALCALTVVVFSVIVFCTWYFQCAIAPELYGLNALLQVIQQ